MFQNMSDLWEKCSQFMYILRKQNVYIMKNIGHNFVKLKYIYEIIFFT